MTTISTALRTRAGLLRGMLERIARTEREVTELLTLRDEEVQAVVHDLQWMDVPVMRVPSDALCGQVGDEAAARCHRPGPPARAYSVGPLMRMT